MLTTDDVGTLFAAMRTAYGPQWKHGKGAIGVWRNMLSRYSEREVMQAANRAMELHVKHPPTLPEFVQLVKGRPAPANTYLEPPAGMTTTQSCANRVLLGVVKASFGVDRATMDHLVRLKNALIEDHDSEKPTAEFVQGLQRELTALAESCDPERRQAELDLELEKRRRRRAA